MKNTKTFARVILENRVTITIIVLFHVVGLIGFIVPSLTPLFLKLVPWHLLLMTALIIYSHNRPGGRLLLFVLSISVIGFAAEFTGVHKGWLFGNYSYGQTLGIKLFDVPLMIGINWFLLIYAAGVLMQRSRVKSATIRIGTGALILAFLDLLIEPVAIHFNYWHWESRGIPDKNYICWFLLSALMLFVFELFKFKWQSKVAPALLVMQFVFFMVLRVFI